MIVGTKTFSPKKIFGILILLFGGLLGIFLFAYSPNKSSANRSFVKIPVRFFPFRDRPVIDIEIEEKKYSLLVDLGSSNQIVLHKQSMEKIQKKKLVSTSNYTGVKGNAYLTQTFLLPDVKILDVTIKGLKGYEESPKFIRDAKIGLNPFGMWNQFIDKLELALIDGRIGGCVFKKIDCLFDFPNSNIIIAKDMPSLMNEAGYSFEKCIKIPFNIEKYGIVFSIETDLGSKKMMLDTGATHSIFKKKGNPPEQWTYEMHPLIIGGTDFGNWKFWLLEYSDVFDCDGILGVDFFKKHAIYFDFHNNIAYIKN